MEGAQLQRIVFDEPIAPNKYYTIKPVGPVNTLVLRVGDFEGKLSQLHLCLYHKVTVDRQICEHCYPFKKFPYTFLLKTKHGLYNIPPPSSFSEKSTNYFSSFLDTCKTNHSLRLPRLIRRRRTPTKKLTDNGERKLERAKYDNFVRSDFSGGPLSNMLSGKKAFIRHKILGKNVNGYRMTLTIDTSLPPDRITVPSALYNKLDLATPLVIINRSPSINSRAIHVVQMMPHEDDGNDYTVKINAFVVDGMHADQDGDELHIIVLEKQGQLPTRHMKQAISELKKLSWAFGLRHDGFYRPRFDFSQFHKTVCSVYDAELKRVSPLWASLGDKSIKSKLDTIMHLGCSLLYDEVDVFVRLVGQLIRHNKAYPTHGSLDYWGGERVLTVDDILFESDYLTKHVIESGAKGSMMHRQVFLRYLFEPNVDQWFNDAVDKFNHTVMSSNDMSVAGQEQFNLMYEYNSLHLTNGDVYKNGDVYLKSFLDSDLGHRITYNNTAVTWALDHLTEPWDQVMGQVRLV